MSQDVTPPRVPVWDAWIRLFHWSLVCMVTFLLISGETGWQFYEFHRLVGELVVALLLFRICWSVIGSSNASLIALIVSPGSALSHLRDLLGGRVHAERRHNSAGGWAVLVMVLLLGIQAGTGLFIADEDELLEGAFYGSLDYGTSAFLLEVHHTNAHVLQFMVFMHIAMVFFYWARAGQNLIRPMLTGSTNWPADQPVPNVRFAPFWLGLVLLLAVVALCFWWLQW